MHGSPRGRTALAAAALLVTTLAAVPAAAAGATSTTAAATIAASAQPDPLTNLAHIDFLTDTVTPPPQANHTTYQLAADPGIGVLWTYAEPGPDGQFVRVGGGAYDPATDTWGQGAFNADDVSRAAVVYLRHWRQFGDDHSRDMSYDLLRGLTYLQTSSGPNAGNVVLWMQPDGTLNPSAEPVELPDPSDSDASYWVARTIWALGEGYRAFRTADPAFADFLRQRLELSIAAVERQVLSPNRGQTHTLDGLEWPAWLIADGADASSEAIYGLTAYLDAGGSAAARDALRQLADGVAMMQLGSSGEWPFGAVMPWALSRSVWHAWGDQMGGSLATAGAETARADWVRVAARQSASFTPHLLAQGGPDNGWLPAPAERTQIAYGADATLHNLVATADATGNPAFTDLAGIAAAWYFGNNPAGAVMYDPVTGRTFDGVNQDGSVNRNSGAESTIHGLLSMMLLDGRPEIAARARAAQRTDHVTWQLVEGEHGVLDGPATVVTPESAWTGESLWSGGAYVRLAPRGSVAIPVDLPVADRYRLFGVSEIEIAPLHSFSIGFELAGVDAGVQAQGGARPQGISVTPGYLGIRASATRTAVPAGEAVLTATGIGRRGDAQLDAVLVQPEVEWLVLSDAADGGQALLRSFADRRQVRTVTIDGAEGLEARTYNRSGRLTGTARSNGDSIAAPVEPLGGFTIVTG